jgi:hypothetical protein
MEWEQQQCHPSWDLGSVVKNAAYVNVLYTGTSNNVLSA